MRSTNLLVILDILHCLAGPLRATVARSVERLSLSPLVPPTSYMAELYLRNRYNTTGASPPFPLSATD